MALQCAIFEKLYMFKKNIFKGMHILLSKFIILIYLNELNLVVTKITAEISISIKTALNAITLLLKNILLLNSNQFYCKLGIENVYLKLLNTYDITKRWSGYNYKILKVLYLYVYIQ